MRCCAVLRIFRMCRRIMSLWRNILKTVKEKRLRLFEGVCHCECSLNNCPYLGGIWPPSSSHCLRFTVNVEAGNKLLRRIRNYLPIRTESHPIRRKCLSVQLLVPQKFFHNKQRLKILNNACDFR